MSRTELRLTILANSLMGLALGKLGDETPHDCILRCTRIFNLLLSEGEDSIHEQLLSTQELITSLNEDDDDVEPQAALAAVGVYNILKTQ